jgi:hypothetical protein
MDPNNDRSASDLDTPEALHRRKIIAVATQSVIPCVAGMAADGGGHVFSGTFVRLETECFVLTARHCLEDIKDRRSLRVTAASSGVSIGHEGIQGHFWATSPDDPIGSDAPPRLDIGLLWLHKTAAHSLQPDWINLDRLRSDAAVPGARVVLAGYPSALAAKSGALELMLHISEVSEETPAGLRSEPKQHVDVFIRYDPEDIVDLRRLTKDGTAAPHGLSGSPVFVIQQVDGSELWTPDSLQLAAVQSSFLPRMRLLRATRTELARRTLQDFVEVLRGGEGQRPRVWHEFIEPRPMPDHQL